MTFSKKKFILYKWIIVFLFFHSMYPWFTLGIEIVTFYLVVGPLLFVSNYRSNFFEFKKSRNYVIVAFLFLNLWMARGGSPIAYIQAVACTYIIGSIVYLKDELKAKIFPLITKIFAIILGVSMFAYLAHMAGTPMPHTFIQYRDYTIQNYYLFVTSWGNFLRFQGPFLEPGHLTMGLAPVLFINRYNFKDRYVLVLLIAQILSLSLAGYLTLGIGYCMQILFDDESIKKRIQSIVLAAVFVFGAVYLLGSVFGDNILEEKIFSRLEWNGTNISGNNRSSDMLDFEYEKTLNSEYAWTGNSHFDQTRLEKGVSGYKLFVVRQGLLGTILAVIAYLLSILNYNGKERRSQKLLCLLLLLLFIQNAYPIWWCMIICAFFGAPIMSGNLVRKDF